MYTIIHLKSILNDKYLRRFSWIINPNHCTSISLVVKYMCTFSMRFVPINLYYILNWWYLLSIRIIFIALYVMHKEMSFFVPYMSYLMRNSFLSILALMQKNTNYMIITYYLTSILFPPSSSVNLTLFKSSINPRTKLFISH